MALRLGESDFVAKRIQAERFFQEKKMEYTLEDIYDVYGRDLTEIEWGLELENVSSIKRNVKYLKPDDLIVSDMYLGEKRLRELIEKAGIKFDGKIIVSCYGKHSGKVWKELKGQIISHCGDNKHTDIAMPLKYGIRSRHARTEMNKIEVFYMKYSEDLAWWVRKHRLEHVWDEAGTEHLEFIQISLNFPMLFAMSHLLDDYLRYFQVGKPLFMSRDTQMLQKMWQKLNPAKSSEYLYVSRECLRGSSENYFKYLNSRLNANTVMVDLASSGGSLKKALPRLSETNPKLWTLIFLPAFKVDTTGIDLKYVTTNNKTLINNTHLEMLNYADHWHVGDVDKMGKPVFDQEREYDMNLVMKYHGIFSKMVQDIPTGSLINAKDLVSHILPWIHAEGNYLRRLFPMHMQFEGKRKRILEAV
jgi:hypothetical protein